MVSHQGLRGRLLSFRAQLTKVNQLLASGGVGSLFKVRAQTGEDGGGEGGGALCDAVALVGGLGAVGGVVLAVELVQLVEEARGHAVLVVKLDGALDRGVAYHVAVCEVLGNDARPRLLLLCDLVPVTFGVDGAAMWFGVVGADARCGRHADVRGAELGVVEEEGGLGGGVLLCSVESAVCFVVRIPGSKSRNQGELTEGHGRRLGLFLGLHVKAGDLAAGQHVSISTNISEQG